MTPGFTTRSALMSLLALATLGCGANRPPTTDGGEERKKMVTTIEDAQVEATAAALVAMHGEAQAVRIERGVRQAAMLWRETDGDAAAFDALCKEAFVADEAGLDALLDRFEDNVEQIAGHLHEIGRHLREPTDLDRGPIAPIDRMFAGYDLGAHVLEDMFASRIGFAILLNFELHGLDAMLADGASWSREDWARARAAQLFESRVPPEVRQAITDAYVAADAYISEYNIHMHHLLTADGRRLFPKGLKLISHWGLRDELKSHYGREGGLERQRMIQAVMERIILQEIPAAVIDNPHVDWVVETGEVRPTQSPDAPEGYEHRAAVKADGAREPDTRYEMWRGYFNALRLEDPYDPALPTYVQRKFEREREIPKTEVVRLLESVLTSPTIADMGALVSKRLDRPLEPFDIWYEGFRGRGATSEEELDRIVRGRYPTVQAFQADIPSILEKLGFSKETAAYLGTKITVDPARGAGHAMGAERREDNAHLRTRIPADGMNYKGFNIAIHELGHNVEQVLSLNRMDHHLLRGVPNTAFTEGFAFAFQAHDLELLGVAAEDPLRDHLDVLDALWQTYEIAGVAMVDIEVWDWLYANPGATAGELREAVVCIAKDVWNRYFAPVFGEKDQPLLAVYSHLVDAGMYIPDYPVGALIQFQVEAHFDEKGLASEMERMCKIGAVTPAEWMRQAVGDPISAEPMLAAGAEAVKALAGRP